MIGAPYPIILDLTKKNIAVIGGGKAAHRKIKKSLLADIVPTVINPELVANTDQAKINWIQDIYRRKYVEEMSIIIACTNDAQVNDRVKAEATHLQLVNNTNDKTNSDFCNLATLSPDDMFISISTVRKLPGVAKEMKNKIREWVSKRFHKEFE